MSILLDSLLTKQSTAAVLVDRKTLARLLCLLLLVLLLLLQVCGRMRGLAT
jgi:hypothetical protein